MTEASVAATAAHQDPVVVVERLDAELSAVDPEKFLVANFDVAGAASTVLGHLESIASLRPNIESTFRSFNFRYLDYLGDYAVAVKYLANAEENARPRVDPEVSKALEEGRAFRATLGSIAKMFAAIGVFDAGIVADIERLPRGYEGTSNAILRYAALFVDHRAQVDGKMPLSLQTIEQGRAKAVELGAMGATPDGKSLEEITDLRRRAVTLFLNAYQEVQSAIEYVRRHEGDAAEFVPTLANHRGGSKGESKEAGKKDPLPEDGKAEKAEKGEARAASGEARPVSPAPKPASDKSAPPLPDSPFKRGE